MTGLLTVTLLSSLHSAFPFLLHSLTHVHTHVSSPCAQSCESVHCLWSLSVASVDSFDTLAQLSHFPFSRLGGPTLPSVDPPTQQYFLSLHAFLPLTKIYYLMYSGNGVQIYLLDLRGIKDDGVEIRRNPQCVGAARMVFPSQ